MRMSLPEGLSDVTAPAHSCLILMLLDNERTALSVHVDNVLLERLLKGQKHWPGGRRVERKCPGTVVRETGRCEALNVED